MASKTAKFKKKINGVIYDLNIISDANSIKVDDKGGTVASMLEGFNTKLQDLDTTIQEADPAGLRTDITTIQGEMATYGTKVSTLETTVADQATEIDSKANADDVYDKIEVDAALDAKANSTNVYTKTEVDTALDAKADDSEVSDLNDALTTLTATVADQAVEIDNKADSTEVTAALNTKANSTDVYTKTEVDTALDAKADDSEVSDLNDALTTLTATVEGHTTEIANKANSADVTAALADKANSADVYTKNDVDTALAAKTDKEVAGTNGKALIFNEGDGGGAKFENSDNVTKSFAGVNDGVAGIYAQLYAVEKQSSGKSRGSKFDVTLGGIYYTTGQDSEGSPTDRDVSANEIAVKGDLADLADTVYTKAEVDAAIAAAVPTTQAIEAIIENYLNTHNN